MAIDLQKLQAKIDRMWDSITKQEMRRWYKKTPSRNSPWFKNQRLLIRLKAIQ